MAWRLEDWAKAKADGYPGDWGMNRDYYAYKPGRTDGVYSAVGEEIQTLTAATDPASFKYQAQLFDGSANTACSPPADGKATLHPAEAGKLAVFIYRGENVFRVNADKLPPGQAIEVTLQYRAGGRAAEISHVVASVPHYFVINAPFELRKITNYDGDFNNEEVRMVGYRLALVGTDLAEAAPSLPPDQAEPKFKAAYPHPADMNVRRDKKPDAVETDPMQTGEFFPQSRVVLRDKDKLGELITQAGKTTNYAQHRVFQQLGDYPGAIDFLIEQLPKASIDGTVAIVKALAQIADPKAIDPLLAKWNAGHRRPYDPNGSPGGAPGTRYIPDALTAIALKTGQLDPRIVPALVAPLNDCRFDFRLHVAHALGELGRLAPVDSDNRKLAIETLKDLADHDPVAPSREEAAEALKKLTGPPP